MITEISIPTQQIADLCYRYHIRKLALFGSVLRNDFRPDSDLDVLVEFEPNKTPGDLKFNAIQTELSALFGRYIDLNTAEDLSRYFRQRVIDSARIIFERNEHDGK